MTNIKCRLISKNYDWWVELDNGKQLRVYYIKVYNSSDWYTRYKGKKYNVSLDTEGMTAEIELGRELLSQ
jgi:hypothetical protein